MQDVKELKYTVIIPSKNEEATIGRLLETLKNQSVPPMQIIVADKSDDSTPEILKKYHVEVVEGDNRGYIGKARNNGAEIAKGTILIFIDADVNLKEKFIENALNYFEDKHLDIATTTLEPFNKSLVSVLAFSLYNTLKKVQQKTRIVLSEAGTCLIIKKEVFNKLGRFNPGLKNAEDVDLIRRAINKKYKFGVVPHSVMTSERRYKGKGLVSIALLVLGAAGLTAMVILKKPPKGKLHDKLIRWYGKTGG